MRKNRFIALGMAVALSVSALSGCGVKSDTPIIGKIVGLEKDEIFKVEDLICKKSEYSLLFMDMQMKYKTDFGGSVDWQAKIDNTRTLEDFVRDKTKEDITARYTMASLAKSRGVTLTANEQKAVEEAATKYYETLGAAEKDYTSATLEDVKNLYTNYMLAEKLYNGLTEHIGENVSDEEARAIQIQYIRISVDKYKKSKVKSIFQDITDLVNGGYQEFSREAKQYSQDETNELILKKNEAIAKFEKEAFKLSDKEISNLIEDGNNYYLLYCVNSYLKEETQANKNKIIQSLKQAEFDNQYQAFLNTADTDFNTTVWENIAISDNAEIKANTLMTYYKSMKK